MSLCIICPCNKMSCFTTFNVRFWNKIKIKPIRINFQTKTLSFQNRTFRFLYLTSDMPHGKQTMQSYKEKFHIAFIMDIICLLPCILYALFYSMVIERAYFTYENIVSPNNVKNVITAVCSIYIILSGVTYYTMVYGSKKQKQKIE